MVLKDHPPVSCAGQDEPIEHEVIIDAYLKGIAYAKRKLTRFSNSGLGAVITPEDVAHTALMKVLGGERPWDQEKVPKFTAHLLESIRGEIANAYRSSGYRYVYRGAAFDEVVATEEDQSSSTPWAAMEREELKRAVEFLLDYIKQNRRDLLPVARFMYEAEADRPKEIAAGLEMEVSEVNTAKFALKRILKGKKFLISYIAHNHVHLEQTAIAVLDKKLERAKEIAGLLGISEERARFQRDELSLALENMRNIRRKVR